MVNRISLATLGWVICLVALLAFSPGVADARSAGAEIDRLCSVCHATPGLQMQLADGTMQSVYVDPQTYAGSVHGSALQCTACHAEVQAYPHATGDLAQNRSRNAPELVRKYTACGECHPEQLAEFLGSIHAGELATGNQDSAICSDCHGSHDIQPADPSQVGLPLGPGVHACGACHEDQYAQYQASAHGRALLEKSDTNVPACIDCHGTHGMGKATTAVFRAGSPYLCASCHADEELMAQYGLSPDVMRTYVADFHGTTAQLYPHPGAEGPAPEAAVCYDCHGAHDIQYASDPNSAVSRANLVQVCQECHEDASDNFPAAWVGHYAPTPKRNAPVFWTAQFFLVLTVGVITGMIGHISLDVLRAIINKLKGGSSDD